MHALSRAGGYELLVIDSLESGHAEAVPEGVALKVLALDDAAGVVAVLRGFRPHALIDFAAYLDVAAGSSVPACAAAPTTLSHPPSRADRDAQAPPPPPAVPTGGTSTATAAIERSPMPTLLISTAARLLLCIMPRCASTSAATSAMGS